MRFVTNSSPVRGDWKLHSSSKRGRKTGALHATEDVVTAVVEQTSQNVAGVCSGRIVARQLDFPYTTVRRCLRKALETYPYKLHRHQELQPGDAGSRAMFALTFLALMQLDGYWPWNIL